MTERIQHIIDGIRLKYKSLYSQLESERLKNVTLEAELMSLKNENANLLEQKNEFVNQIEKMKSELEEIERQKIEEKDAVEDNRNQEIDDLVREIEHCINQLKQ